MAEKNCTFQNPIYSWFRSDWHSWLYKLLCTHTSPLGYEVKLILDFLHSKIIICANQ